LLEAPAVAHGVVEVVLVVFVPLQVFQYHNQHLILLLLELEALDHLVTVREVLMEVVQYFLA
jgi:hypothetical protein